MSNTAKAAAQAKMVSTESRAQLAVHRSEFGRNQHPSHGETVADAFGHRNQVRLHPQMLVGEELARTAVATLDFIANQHRIRFVTCLPHALHELGSGQPDTSDPLNTLHNHGTHIAFGQLRLESVQIIQKASKSHAPLVVDGSYDFRIVRCLHGQRRTPMERF